MPRKKKNRENDSHRGSGRGRGRKHGRGGPKGVPTAVAGATGSAHRGPRHLYPHTNAEFDVTIQRWEDPPIGPGTNGGGNVNRGYRPWNGGALNPRSGARTPSRGMNSPRRGDLTPRGAGAGRGRGSGRGRGLERDDGGDYFSAPPRPYPGDVTVGARTRPRIARDAPLSGMLYAERPLLRPVKFVRATLTPFLFQHSEEVLEPASSQATDVMESSHTPPADRIARLSRANIPDLDSEPEGYTQDALEEIDFADLAQVRAEVDAIAQGIATNQNAYDNQEEIEEVDFAEMAAIRAKVDATKPQEASREEDTREAFTGVYSQIVPVAQTLSPTVLPTADDPLDPTSSIQISKLSNQESFSHARNIVVTKEVPRSPIALPNVSTKESPLPTALETHPTSSSTGNIPRRPDAPPYDDSHQLFFVDTTPTRPFAGSSASDAIPVDRADHDRTLGEEDEELIVYVAPYPRLADASPVPLVPRVKLPQTSMLTGRSPDAPGGPVTPAREDNASPTPASDQSQKARGNLEDKVGESCLSLASLTLEPNIPASASASTSTPTPTQRPHMNVAPRVHKKVRLQRRRQRQKKQGQMGFREFGLMMSEARLREEDTKERQHSKWNTRRKGDSDLEWGTEDEDGESEDGEEEDRADAVLDDSEGMEVDPDLKLDIDAMRGFLKSMSAEGAQFVTMDDLEDEARMQQEDGEGKGGPEGSSDSEHSDEEVDAENEDEDEEEEREELEDEEEFNIEEGILIAESEDDREVESSEDSDDELSPASSFKARLLKVRERSRAQRPETLQEIADEEDDKGMPPTLPSMRTADDEDMLERTQSLLEENSQILADHDSKEDMAALHQVHMSEWNVKEPLDDPEFTTPVSKKKGKGKFKQATGPFAAELQAQWAKDRAKKAEQKQQRRAARLLTELDTLDSDAVLFFDPTMTVDVRTLEPYIRRLANDEEYTSMVLPPMDNEMRKMAHEMARVFGMKSVSQGEGDERYTTLFKASQKPGKGKGKEAKVREAKVKALMKQYTGQGKSGRGSGNGKNGSGKSGSGKSGSGKSGSGKSGSGKSGSGKSGSGKNENAKEARKVKHRDTPKHREGEEVGKEAPKIGQSNIGFKMLASMGWSEGDRIGGTGSEGIEAPLTAIIKHSKLGLGATR